MVSTEDFQWDSNTFSRWVNLDYYIMFVESFLWGMLSSWFKFHRQELPLPLCMTYDMISFDSLKQKLLFALLIQGTWIQTVNSRKKAPSLSSSLPHFPFLPSSFHSPILPHCLSHSPSISSSFLPQWWQVSIWCLERTYAKDKRKYFFFKVCLFFFLGKSFLHKHKLRQHWALWHPWVDVTDSVLLEENL